ncbi:hypothetical protein DFR58_10869 [Anaerobacterium chartisolvens]|uniref:Flagellar Assembly Protein A N-terminal region domain-containing protein n=1 Tax=Anaerobacterium chartisolvens TaxID=1297424 RepID=A0A369B781_9FIRM|nr:FapA family protein [Anaerobacterium chartisolvens]RCX17175.1 hypothetical protein DFR58_10869 [Anaerobacterium chartisolvens]
MDTAKERVVIEISSSQLEAYVTYNMSPEELKMENRESLVRETSTKLREASVVFGIVKDIFMKEINSGERYLIAAGVKPVDGTDSIIKMYQMKDSKPEIHKNGKADFYDLKLINRVKAGDWLGERIDATDGVPGQTVSGTPINASRGKTTPLNYDKNTVAEAFDEGKTTLYSKINGAVNYADGKVMVSNHLEIDGDVDFKTGNIKFDGYITIKGTVADSFSVEATKDIEINGQFGLGHVKEIVSTQGSIFIKGGIASKGLVEIKAAKNVFTKFVDNTSITCFGAVHVGYYCRNSIIAARELAMDSPNGQIIGGTATVEIRVAAPIIGSEIEKKTVIEVTGFSRSLLREELTHALNKITCLKNEQQRVRASLLQRSSPSNAFQSKEYNKNQERLSAVREEIKELEAAIKDISRYLKAHGEGEICIAKKLYPNCILCIKKNIVEASSVVPPVTYYVEDNELKHT